MATQVLQQPAEQGVQETSTAGRLDRLIGIPARFPGPALVWYAALVPAMTVVLSLPSWVVGDLALGSFAPDVLAPALLTAYLLGLIHVLDRVARAAFRDIRAALGLHPDEARLATDLTAIPDRPAILVIAVAEVIITVGFFSNETQLQRLRAQPLSLGVFGIVAWWVAIAAVGLVLLHTVRQLRLVSRLHLAATSIDLFDPGSVVAFSRLTSATAIGLLLVPILFVAIGSIAPTTRPTAFEIAQQGGLVLLATAAFVLPLRGMHDRMAKEKARMQREVHQRMRATVARIHGAVDAEALADADQLNKTLSSLIAERDVIARLSTWPWSPGTLRGFGSAVLLSLVIWLLIRILERAL